MLINRFKSGGNGFTLVEMIIALAIVALVATFAVSNLIKSQKRGLDSKRQGDMRTIQNAFEQYFVVNGRYPQNQTEAASEFPSRSLPVDPRNRGSYVYGVSYDTVAPVGETYCACALLEVVAGNSTNNSCNYASSGQRLYFCVNNLQ